MEKKMSWKNKKAAFRYLRRVRKSLTGSWGIKVMAMRDLRGQVLDYVGNLAGEVTVEQLEEFLGKPQVVGESYFGKSNLEALKRRAKRYVIWRSIAIVAILCLIVSVFVVSYYRDNMYTVIYSEIY